VAGHGESLECEGGPGTVSQQVLETVKIARHVAVDERDPDTRVYRNPAVRPGEHVGSGSSVEQARASEPADDALADPLGERGEVSVVDGPRGQELALKGDL
ncbi:MAG: hypothetical protein ACKO1M_05025, partial [Planctomycetota bacterium]